MSEERPTPDLRAWGNDALQALSDAFDKVVRSREASPGIDVADVRAQDWFDLGHLDPEAPGRFPGLGGVQTSAEQPAGARRRGSAAGVRRRGPRAPASRPPRPSLPRPRPRPLRNRSRSRRSLSRSCWPSSTP